VQQEQVSTRSDIADAHSSPAIYAVYPPEKHAPRMIVEARYPADLKAPTLMALIQGNDPTMRKLRGRTLVLRK